MKDQSTKLIIKSLEDEVKRLIEAEEYDEALQAINVLYDFFGLERIDEE